MELDLHNSQNPQIQEAKENLLAVVEKRLSIQDRGDVERALEYAGNYYHGNLRKSGEPYFVHPLHVARLAIEELGLARNAVISAILHDLYDFNTFSDLEIEPLFGTKVLEIIRGMHKISGLYVHNITLHDQNYINLILNIVTDVRIILLKLADRLQNMRNFDHFPKEKQHLLASEIGALYAPIAHRLGLYSIKTEMEEFWLQQTHPGAYKNILRNVEKNSKALNTYIDRFTAPIKKELDGMGYAYEMKGRVKSVFSIWRKMEKQQVGFDEVFDFYAVRVVLKDVAREKEKADCWNVYSIVSNLYRPNPKRMRDWISAPKSSGYESLHATVQGPENRWVEVQIRTQRMDDDAEKGQAAHWKYKESGTGANQHDEWLSRVREVLESPDKSGEDVFIEGTPQVFSPYVFVFTPAGDIKKLPKGATIIDFAYSVHSKVGDQCTGARINGRIVPIRYELKNGETVDVITSRKQKPNESWLSIAVSSRVKNRIKRALREARYKDAELGKEELQRKLKNLNLDENEDYILKLLRHFKLNSAVDLYVAFAHDEIDFNTVRKVCLEDAEIDTDAIVEGLLRKSNAHKTRDDDYLIIGDDISQVNYQLAKCCNPVFGDKIFGFVSVAKGIVIHRNECPNAASLKEKYPYRIIRAVWNDASGEKYFMTDVRVIGIDRKGVLNQISKVFADEMNISIQSMNITAHDGLYEALITFNVRDNDHLNYIVQQLQQHKTILAAERVDS